MSGTPSELRLAGDIVAQFRHLPRGDAAARIAFHLRRFWDPQLQVRLREQVAAGGTGPRSGRRPARSPSSMSPDGAGLG